MIIELLKYSKQKKDAREIIINSEVLANDTGMNAIDIISQYNKSNILIDEVIKRYSQNKPKHLIYSHVFDQKFLTFLKMCEEKGLVVGEVFKDYSEISEKVRTSKQKIQGAIAYPFVSYLISSLIVFFSILRMYKELQKLGNIDLSIFKTVLYSFWPIIIVVGVAILVPLFKFPNKIPILKRAYKELNAFQYLGTIFIFLKSGLSMMDVYEVFRLDKKIRMVREGIDGILDFLTKFLSDTEIYALRIATQTYKIETVFKTLLLRRKENFDATILKISSTLSTVLIFIVVIPVSFMLYTMFKLYMLVSASVAGGTIR